jgi:hypothetical protein
MSVALALLPDVGFLEELLVFAVTDFAPPGPGGLFGLLITGNRIAHKGRASHWNVTKLTDAAAGCDRFGRADRSTCHPRGALPGQRACRHRPVGENNRSQSTRAEKLAITFYASAPSGLAAGDLLGVPRPRARIGHCKTKREEDNSYSQRGSGRGQSDLIIFSGNAPK